jgi:lipopolysaccharide transport system permease protein
MSQPHGELARVDCNREGPAVGSDSMSIGERISNDAGASAPGARRRERTYIRPRRGWQALDLGEVWRTRDLLWMFTVRDVKVRYKQTFFGFAWALVVPVVQVLVFTVFFGTLLGVAERVDADAGRLLPYPLFALTGLIAWNFFKMTVDGASNSLMNNAGIIRKIYVPRLVLPLSSLGKPAVDTAVGFILMIGLLVWYARQPEYDVWISAKVLLSPLIIIGTALPALAVGLIVAAITVHYRDLQQVLPFFTQTLLFATPVIYPTGILQRYEWMIYLNPVAGFVQAHRAAVVDQPFDWLGIGISLSVSVVLLVFGLFYFTRAERQFADVT